MDKLLQKDDGRWDSIMGNMDILFAKVKEIDTGQQRLNTKYNLTTQILEKLLQDQQILHKQIEATGDAVEKLTLAQMVDRQGGLSSSASLDSAPEGNKHKQVIAKTATLRRACSNLSREEIIEVHTGKPFDNMPNLETVWDEEPLHGLDLQNSLLQQAATFGEYCGGQDVIVLDTHQVQDVYSRGTLEQLVQETGDQMQCKLGDFNAPVLSECDELSVFDGTSAGDVVWDDISADLPVQEGLLEQLAQGPVEEMHQGRGDFTGKEKMLTANFSQVSVQQSANLVDELMISMDKLSKSDARERGDAMPGKVVWNEETSAEHKDLLKQLASGGEYSDDMETELTNEVPIPTSGSLLLPECGIGVHDMSAIIPGMKEYSPFTFEAQDIDVSEEITPPLDSHDNLLQQLAGGKAVFNGEIRKLIADVADQMLTLVEHCVTDTNRVVNDIHNKGDQIKVLEQLLHHLPIVNGQDQEQERHEYHSMEVTTSTPTGDELNEGGGSTTVTGNTLLSHVEDLALLLALGMVTTEQELGLGWGNLVICGDKKGVSDLQLVLPQILLWGCSDFSPGHHKLGMACPKLEKRPSWKHSGCIIRVWQQQQELCINTPLQWDPGIMEFMEVTPEITGALQTGFCCPTFDFSVTPSTLSIEET
ncbi:unnamed protein product [Urochloa humidicola]